MPLRVTFPYRKPDLRHAIRIPLNKGDDMKLEMDLLRDLLIYVEEEAKEPISDLQDIKIGDWTESDIAYHVILAEEGGAIKAIIDYLPNPENPDVPDVAYSIQRLTFNGHELLGSIREPKHWKAIKSGAKSAGVATVGALGTYAQAYMKLQISKYLGVELS